METVRQQIISLLSQKEMDARALSREVRIREKEVYDHLVHIARSLAAKGRRLTVRPSRCFQCDYVFEDRKRLTRPGRCPRCKSTRLQNPVFSIA